MVNLPSRQLLVNPKALTTTCRILPSTSSSTSAFCLFWALIDNGHQWSVLALIQAESGWTKDALPLMEEVLKLRKSKLGADHPDTLTSMGNLANRYSEAERREEALKLTEKVVALQKSKFGPDHPDTSMSMGNLAIQYSKAGRRAKALQLAAEVAAMRKSKLGEVVEDTCRQKAPTIDSAFRARWSSTWCTSKRCFSAQR